MTNYNFSIIKNPEGTYHIECLFVVYRELFGEHPSWIDCPGDARDGFNTKFYFLIEDDLSLEDATAKLKDYVDNYSKLIITIENDKNRWDEFPFKDKPIVYTK